MTASAASVALLVPVLLLILQSLPVHAFTNGTMLPSYFCFPTSGYPVSLGAVLKITNLTNPNASLLVASFHNSDTILAKNNLVQIKLGSVATGMPLQSQTIASGQVYRLLVNSTDGNQLDGLIIWAETSPNVKVGSFISTGPKMSVWAPCGPNQVGAVHHQVISDNTMYNELIWMAPASCNGPVQFRGVSVTDGGFGPWINTVKFPCEGTSGLANSAVATIPGQFSSLGMASSFYGINDQSSLIPKIPSVESALGQGLPSANSNFQAPTVRKSSGCPIFS